MNTEIADIMTKPLKSASMLMGAKNTERLLARQEARELDEVIDRLPPDDPLAIDAREKKAKLGDLSGLPPGHELLVQIRQAKERFEIEAAKEQEKPADEEIVKARKLKADENRRAANERRIKNQEHDRAVYASSVLSRRVDIVLAAMSELMRITKRFDQELPKDGAYREKMDKMKGVVDRAFREIMDSRPSLGRTVTNG